jgi:hypothetical protein
MTLTEWMPCTTAPVREGWYDVQRRLLCGSAIAPVERVRFASSKWDWRASESKMSVWVGMDYWRGVTRESLECSGNKTCTAGSCIWPLCKPNELLQKLRGVTNPEGK